MKRTALWAGSLAMSMAAGVMLSGCESAPQTAGKRESSAVALRASASSVAGPFGTAPVLPKVRITCADGNYDYLYTLRTEIGGSKAEPKGSQGVDLGKGGVVPSAYRLNLERGFAVVGGCFPVSPFAVDKDTKDAPPRPWSPLTAVNALASAAQGTRYSVYIETDSSKNPIAIYLFRHSGGVVHAWTFDAGTDPQMPGSVMTMPAGAIPPKYILGQPDANGVWQIALKDLPPSGDKGDVRKYFEACDAVAQNALMGFPNCAVPESVKP